MRIVRTTRNCQRCAQTVNVQLVRNITQNGVNQVYWYCEIGQHAINKNGSFIPHGKVKAYGIEPDDLPVINNYSGREVCAVCGSPFTELHHWAPRHLFDKYSENWPKDYLCKKHHALWHRIMTPQMTKAIIDG